MWTPTKGSQDHRWDRSDKQGAVCEASTPGYWGVGLGRRRRGGTLGATPVRFAAPAW